MSKLPRFLGGALLAVVLYAAFDHGAVASGPAAHVEVAVAAIAAVATVSWFGLNGRGFRASRFALTGLALLVGFAGWSGITVLWSVAPDQTWVELNRAIAYALVVGLAMWMGARPARECGSSSSAASSSSWRSSPSTRWRRS